MITTLAEALSDGPVVLDGGLATQLESQGHNLDSKLWSAALLQDDPDAIVQAHLAYFAAGAQVATTASYQASIDGFAQARLGRADAEQLIQRSCRPTQLRFFSSNKSTNRLDLRGADAATPSDEACAAADPVRHIRRMERRRAKPAPSCCVPALAAIGVDNH